MLHDVTELMRARYNPVDTLDVPHGAWIYRVFLLPTTLQVDLAFAPATDFGAHGPTFRLAFGEARDVPQTRPPDPRELIGYGWLYALHVRSSINRRRPWHALYMLNSMRDQVLALACVRAGLPAREARGADFLPVEDTRALEAAIARSLRLDDLISAFRATSEALVREVRLRDAPLASKLEPVLRLVVESVV